MPECSFWGSAPIGLDSRSAICQKQVYAIPLCVFSTKAGIIVESRVKGQIVSYISWRIRIFEFRRFEFWLLRYRGKMKIEIFQKIFF